MHRMGNFEFRQTHYLFKEETYYEIVKWTPNSFYNKEQEYEAKLDNNKTILWYYKSEFANLRIPPEIFKKEELCYTVATFKQDEDTGNYSIESVEDRIISSIDDDLDLKNLYLVIRNGFSFLNNKKNDQLIVKIMRDRIKKVSVPLFPHFCQALCLIFITARVFGFTDWPWYWLVCPMLFGPLMWLVLYGFKYITRFIISIWGRK